MAQSAVETYFVQSPEKVYRRADNFSKTLGRFTQLPSSKSKSIYVRNLAEDRKDDIRFTIQSAKYQNQLYKKLEENDEKQRNSISKKIQLKDQKIETNLEEIKKKSQKNSQKINKHLGEVYKKHVEKQKHKKEEKDKQALKLRKSLLQFYDKQRQRRRQADAKQLSVSTCYHDAVGRLDKIHQKNQQYAQKSQREYMIRMARNSARDKNILNLSRLKSAENRKKAQVYDANCQILQQKQHRYIQTYCKDLDQSLKAFEYKDKVDDKTKQRITKFFKDRVQKWHGLKKRVDEQKEHVSQRCVSIMEKTSKAFFRQTISSFKDSSKNWLNRVQQNKSMIYERDEEAKDKLMEIHNDLRLRNTSSFKVQERMDSLKRQAKKLSNDFL